MRRLPLSYTNKDQIYRTLRPDGARLFNAPILFHSKKHTLEVNDE